MAMSTPSMEGQMSELEMDNVLEEYGLLEAGMTSIEKLQLIQTLEASKISAQTEKDSRLREDDTSPLPSSPFLRHQTPSVAGTSASCPSAADEPSPLIGAPTMAQRRRPLHVLPSSGQALKRTNRCQRSPQSVDDRHRSSQSADDRHQQSSQSADNRSQLSQSADDHQQSSQSVKSRRQQVHSSASRHQPVRSADGRNLTSDPVDSSGDESPPIDPSVGDRRLSTISESSAERRASLAKDSPSPQLLGAESAASSPRPIPHFVNNEGRSEAAERSERAVRLLELVSDANSREENVRRVFQHMELEQQQMLTAAEHRSWPDDILPSRSFQESSVPSPLDAARLVYQLPTGAGQSRASASREPSPEPPPPPPLRRQPATPSGLQVEDASRHHSRANQLLQRAINTHPTKKPTTTPKLLLNLSNRSGASAATAPDRDLATGPSTSAATAPVLPLLPPLPAGAEPPLAGTSASRRRRASLQSETTGPAKQARRRPPDAEIRPAPLRLSTERTEHPKRSKVPLVTKVQTLGGLPKRSASSHSLATLSTSSSDDDSAPRIIGHTTATHRPVPSTGGAVTPSRASNDVSGGVSAGASVGAEPAAGAAGDAAAGQRIECPLCGDRFTRDVIEIHASRCEDEGVMEIVESPSPPLRRSVTTARTARERTPGGQQRCRLCNELFEEGAAYLEHVDECLRHRRRSNGGEGVPASESDRRPATERDYPAEDGPRPADQPRSANPTAGFSTTFQRVSVQANSSIDYHNQFPAVAGGRARRGRRRRGRGVSRTRGNGRRA